MITLKEGDVAPAFSGKNELGETISLSQLKGKKVVLYFYPKDATPTCTVEAKNLRDNYELLRSKGYEVIGVSPDDDKSHQKFQQSHNLPFTLLADTDRKIIDAYGVWGEKSMFGKKYMGVLRTTFVIDEKGIIKKIFLKPQSSKHAEEILKAMG